MNRYEIDIAVHKVEGYIIPRPLESPDSAFRRARSECVAALRTELEFVEQLSFEQFKGTRRKWRPRNATALTAIAESERLISDSGKTGEVEDWHSLERQRTNLLACLKELVSVVDHCSAQRSTDNTVAAAKSDTAPGVCQVTVATYEHNRGVDTRVFSEPELAVHWKASLADARWEQKLPDVPRPNREVMGDEYFDLIEGEFFEAQVCNVERAAEVVADAADSPSPG